MYAIPAAVTMSNASASLVALRRAIDAGETEVSLAALAHGHSDSSAVAVVLAAVRHGQLSGKAIRVSGVPPALRSLAKLYGVEALIGGDGGLATRSPA